MKLSVLCISKLEDCSLRFLRAMDSLSHVLDAQFVLMADGGEAFYKAAALDVEALIERVDSKGYIESVLDEGVSKCNGDYILRLDDDECASPAMVEWLMSLYWTKHDHWEFPRMHLWHDGVIMAPQLFPDHQTRLSIKSKSGGRYGVHAGSPFGGGETAPCCIEHHKFVVKDQCMRQSVAARYDAYHPGYGTGNMKPFSLPEEAFIGQAVDIVSLWDGSMPRVSEWARVEQW